MSGVPLLDLRAQYSCIEAGIDEAIRRVVESQRFILGPEVEALEKQIAHFTGARHAIACASGTDALLLTLRAFDLRPGDEVIIPAFTFFATAGAVWNCGLRPVFVDVDADTFNVTADSVRAALTDRSRALIAVHLFGQMAPMEALNLLAAEYGLATIEDAAQSIGARQQIGGKLRHAGEVGLAGAFSFFPTKNLGAFGDAGLVTTSDDVLADRIAKLRVHGAQQMYHHEIVGTNSRLDALQAAVLSVKLPHLEQWTERRRRNAAYYTANLAALSEFVVVPKVLAGNEHVYNLFTVRVQRRDALREHLEKHGVGTGVYYPVPLHLQECFRPLGYRAGDLPVSEALASEVLSLPIYPELQEAQLARVVTLIHEFYTRN
jgi:dTDP-4-amino-4,6-dideoxygalactose transaminase